MSVAYALVSRAICAQHITHGHVTSHTGCSGEERSAGRCQNSSQWQHVSQEFYGEWTECFYFAAQATSWQMKNKVRVAEAQRRAVLGADKKKKSDGT